MPLFPERNDLMQWDINGAFFSKSPDLVNSVGYRSITEAGSQVCSIVGAIRVIINSCHFVIPSLGKKSFSGFVFRSGANSDRSCPIEFSLRSFPNDFGGSLSGVFRETWMPNFPVSRPLSKLNFADQLRRTQDPFPPHFLCEGRFPVSREDSFWELDQNVRVESRPPLLHKPPVPFV